MDISSITKMQTGFEYVEIPRRVSEKEFGIYCERTKAKFASLAKGWNDDQNTIWLLRHYMAIKMVLASTLLFNSYRYARESNLRIVEPYLLYYCILNLSRAFLWTVPVLDNGDIETLKTSTHERIINLTVDNLRLVSGILEDDFRGLLGKAKVIRELFSYQFPANGLGVVESDYDNICESVESNGRLLAELAQLHSEFLVGALNKHARGDYDYKDGFAMGFEYSLGKRTVLDDEDYYRIGRMVRKTSRPHDLFSMTTEGLVEDFFGAWYPREFDLPQDAFDPGRNLHVFFSPL